MIPLRDINPSRTTPWITWGLMLLCGLVFLLQLVQPPELQALLVRTYGLVPLRVSAWLAGEADAAVLGTVFTSMFMHGGLLHIASNLWFLRIFGDNVEDHFGKFKYLLFYLASGAGAVLLQWAIAPHSSIPMVGASGAIAGVMAAYLVLYPRARVQALLPIFVFLHFIEVPAFTMIGLWFALQVVSGLLADATQGGVAYWAHIGGFLTGLVLALPARGHPPPPAHRSAW